MAAGTTATLSTEAIATMIGIGHSSGKTFIEVVHHNIIIGNDIDYIRIFPTLDLYQMNIADGIDIWSLMLSTADQTCNLVQIGIGTTWTYKFLN